MDAIATALGDWIDAAPWKSQQVMLVHIPDPDTLRGHGGVVYRCIQPHTNYDPGHTPNLTPSLWTPQG